MRTEWWHLSCNISDVLKFVKWQLPSYLHSQPICYSHYWIMRSFKSNDINFPAPNTRLVLISPIWMIKCFTVLIYWETMSIQKSLQRTILKSYISPSLCLCLTGCLSVNSEQPYLRVLSQWGHSSSTLTSRHKWSLRNFPKFITS